MLAACSAPRPAPLAPVAPVATTATHVPALALDIAYVRAPAPIEPIPFAPDPPDDGTTRGAMAVPDEALVGYAEADELSVDELPAIDAAWKKRSSIRYEGFVSIMMNIVDGKLRMSLAAFDGPAGAGGLYRAYDLTWTEDIGALDQLVSRFPEHVHALLDIQPSSENTRMQVAIYTPPDENVVLVATKRTRATAWTPLLRVDAPESTSRGLYWADPH